MAVVMTGCTMVPYYRAQGELSKPEAYQEKIVRPLTDLLKSNGYTSDDDNIHPRFYGITRYKENDVKHIKSFTKSIDNNFVDIYIVSDADGFVITLFSGEMGTSEVSTIKQLIENKFAEYFEKNLITIEKSPYVYLN